jgi:retinol-binding protein 3
MATLNHADALIIDLRYNRGGYGNMVMLLSSYLFDHPQYIYNPRENTNPQSWTQSPVLDNQLADKPAYLLTSAITISAAEQFSYNLKMLKRATLVGETTRGSAHSGVFYRLDDHFGMGIPEARPINPYGANDWEGAGITPDVRVPAADVLKTAIELAERRVARK